MSTLVEFTIDEDVFASLTSEPEDLFRKCDWASDDAIRAGLVPTYQTSGSSGADLRCALPDDRIIQPGEIVLIPTGIRVAIPESYEGQLRIRSGLSIKNNLSMPNGVGTIDSDYRGQIFVPLVNLANRQYSIRPMDRIAQLIISRCTRATFIQRSSLSATERNEGGFGSTGED